MKNTHQSFINDLVSRLEDCKIKFVRGSEQIKDDTIFLDFDTKKSIADIEQLISNQLMVMGIENRYLPFSNDCHTWLLFGKSSCNVWHIVAYKTEGRFICQWRNLESYQ